MKKRFTVMCNSIYRLTTSYWTSKNAKCFRRRLHELHDSTGIPRRFFILQYVVKGEVQKFTDVHGNTKTKTYVQVREC